MTPKQQNSQKSRILSNTQDNYTFPISSRFFVKDQQQMEILNSNQQIYSQLYYQRNNQIELNNQINGSQCLPQQQNLIPNNTSVNQNKPKKQRNNNIIKKLGRLLLDNKKSFDAFCQNGNILYDLMINQFTTHCKIKQQDLNIDHFNREHFMILFTPIESKYTQLSKLNLLIMRKILTYKLRKSILNSSQITHSNKVKYLNCLKSQSLRAMNIDTVSLFKMPILLFRDSNSE